MNKVLKLVAIILLLVFLLIISLIGLPIVEDPSVIQWILMSIIYSSIFGSLIYVWMIFDRLTSTIDSVNTGIDLSKYLYELYKSKRNDKSK